MPDLPEAVLQGGEETYAACQAEARRVRQRGGSALRAPSAALVAGGAGGQRVEGGLQEADPRDGSVLGTCLAPGRRSTVGSASRPDGRRPASSSSSTTSDLSPGRRRQSAEELRPARAGLAPVGPRKPTWSRFDENGQGALVPFVSMGNLGIYFLFLIPPLVIGFWIQHRLKTTIAKQMQVAVANGLTGEQVARTILDHNGLTDVPVNPAPGGPLSITTTRDTAPSTCRRGSTTAVRSRRWRSPRTRSGMRFSTRRPMRRSGCGARCSRPSRSRRRPGSSSS